MGQDTANSRKGKFDQFDYVTIIIWGIVSKELDKSQLGHIPAKEY